MANEAAGSTLDVEAFPARLFPPDEQVTMGAHQLEWIAEPAPDGREKNRERRAGASLRFHHSVEKYICRAGVKPVTIDVEQFRMKAIVGDVALQHGRHHQ